MIRPYLLTTSTAREHNDELPIGLSLVSRHRRPTMLTEMGPLTRQTPVEHIAMSGPLRGCSVGPEVALAT